MAAASAVASSAGFGTVLESCMVNSETWSLRVTPTCASPEVQVRTMALDQRDRLSARSWSTTALKVSSLRSFSEQGLPEPCGRSRLNPAESRREGCS